MVSDRFLSRKCRLSPATMRCFQNWTTLLRPLKLCEGWRGVECWRGKEKVAAALASVIWQPRVRKFKLEERWCQEEAKACWADGWQQILINNAVEAALHKEGAELDRLVCR